MSERRRIIVATADAFEGAAIYDGLSAHGFEPVWLSTIQAAADEMRSRPFDLLIADAAFALSGGLQDEGRPRNPLTPTILIGDAGSGQHVGLSGRAMYLTPPVDHAMLTCFVTMALLQDKPVRRSVRKPVNRYQALVNGVHAHILDVSAEGLRLEIPATIEGRFRRPSRSGFPSQTLRSPCGECGRSPRRAACGVPGMVRCCRRIAPVSRRHGGRSWTLFPWWAKTAAHSFVDSPCADDEG